MRKYVIGIFIGFALSLAVSAHAEVVDMIGKTIDGAFPVKVNGTELAEQAIVVEGTSYLPVRAFGEATGYNVTFDADLGISLNSIETPAPTEAPISATVQPTNTPKQTPKPIPIDQQIKSIDDQIENLNRALWVANANLSVAKTDTQKADAQRILDDYNAQLADLQAKKDALLAQLPTPTPTPTPVPETPTPTLEPSATPTPTDSAQPTVTPTPTPSESPTPTP